MDMDAYWDMAQVVPPRGESIERAMKSFLASPECSYIVVPLAFVLLGILSKWLGRRDNDSAPHRNEFAVGTAVIVMTTGKIISDICAPGAHISLLGSAAFVSFFAISAFSGADRHFSWERNGEIVTNRKSLWAGVIIPDVLALLFFGCYQFMKFNWL